MSEAPIPIRLTLEQARSIAMRHNAPHGSLEVRKYNCTHTPKPDARIGWIPDGPPHFLVQGLPCELEDRGCQKFWLVGGKRFAIRLAGLRALRKFEQETRDLLNLKSLYHESLGTVNARTVYDRVEGHLDLI